MSKRKTKKSKKSRRKIGKGGKVFFIILFMGIITMALYGSINYLTTQINLSKTVAVPVDLEIGGSGDGPGQFKEPLDVAVDSNDDVYVTDFGGHRIQKFDSAGKLLLAFGKEGKDPGDFEQPSGLYIAQTGDLYVCDTFNHRIEKFDSAGTLIKTWSHGFFGPRSIVGDNRGRIYVVDTGNHKIQVFDDDGNFLMEWGGFGSADGKFKEPVGCVVDADGHLYVADSDNLRIQKFDSKGKFLAAFKIATWKGKNAEVPYLAFRNGFLYATNASAEAKDGKGSFAPDSKGAVLKYDLTGKLIAICESKTGFAGAAGLAVDSQNRFYVVEKGVGKIARFVIPSTPPSNK